MTIDRNHKSEVARRGRIARSEFGRHCCDGKQFSDTLKRKVYNGCILLVVTYGAEQGRLTKRVEHKLREAQSNRKEKGLILRYRRRAEWDREYNSEIMIT